MQRASLNRRAFIRQGTLFLAASSLGWNEVSGAIAAEDDRSKPKVRIGVVTDLHCADRPPARSRYYRETPANLTEAAQQFRKKKIECVVELGRSDPQPGFSGHDQAELETHFNSSPPSTPSTTMSSETIAFTT